MKVQAGQPRPRTHTAAVEAVLQYFAANPLRSDLGSLQSQEIADKDAK